MFFVRKKKKPKKQLVLFQEALLEAGYQLSDKDLQIDHQNAACYYKSKKFNVVFPLRYLRETRNLNLHKTLDFTFRGLYTPKRDWVRRFEIGNAKVTFTSRGREIQKELFDVEYYQEMCNSRFTLCPAGDFMWTYRFLEAIMCRSIPIIEREGENFQCGGFIYFYADMEELELVSLWEEKIVQHNYRLFLKRHTLIDHFLFLDI